MAVFLSEIGRAGCLALTQMGGEDFCKRGLKEAVERTGPIAVVAFGALYGAYKGAEWVREKVRVHCLLSVAQHHPNAKQLAQGLKTLKAVKVIDNFRATTFKENGLLTDENRQLLFENASHADSLAEGFQILEENLTWAGTELLTEENQQLLIAHAAHAVSLAKALCTVASAHFPPEIKEQTRSLAIAHPQYADSLVLGIWALHEGGILTEENRQILIDHAEWAKELGEGFKALNAKGSLTLTNRDSLICHAEYARALAGGFVILTHANLLNPKNWKTLLEGKGAHAKLFLKEAADGLDPPTQAKFEEIIKKAQAPVYQVLVLLNKIKSDLPDDVGLRIASFLAPYNEEESLRYEEKWIEEIQYAFRNLEERGAGMRRRRRALS